MLVQISNKKMFLDYMTQVHSSDIECTNETIIGDTFLLKTGKRNIKCFTVKVKVTNKATGECLFSFTGEKALRTRKLRSDSLREMYVNPKLFKQLLG